MEPQLEHESHDNSPEHLLLLWRYKDTGSASLLMPTPALSWQQLSGVTRQETVAGYRVGY